MLTFASQFLAHARGNGVKARALRGSAMTALSVIGSNGLRMLSNIILTRILYPEAFGLMALAYMFIYGLNTFSDVGINTSIVQNKNADEPRFLDTAWTMQIARGVILWLGACALAWPAAQLYQQPELIYILPIIGVCSIVDGFRTTLVAQADRHMQLERQTILTLAGQTIGLILTIALALIVQSVWALAFGAIVGSIVNIAVLQFGMKGDRNRLCWDREYAKQILGFGAFISLATIATFITNMADRAILGLYVSTAELGIYGIGLLIGVAPSMLAQTVASKILFPLYRMKPPSKSKENRDNVFKARRMVSALALSSAAFLAYVGPYLVNFLYDERYAAAGPMITLLALRAVPGHSTIGSQNILLSMGDSLRHFILTCTFAAATLVFTLVGISKYGIAGAIIAMGFATIAIFPLRAAFVARYSGWDAKGEIIAMIIGFTINAGAIALHWQSIKQLFIL